MNNLPALALAVPILGLLAVFLVGGRKGIALGFLGGGVVVAACVVFVVWESGGALVTHVGGWRPPLGITLRADGLAGAMLVVTALVAFGIGVFADFRTGDEPREAFAFWFLLLGVTAALNVAFLGSDLFTLYVALELIAFSAVPLVCLRGTAETYQAALRYLLFALVGSALYLLGAVILYGLYGTLDLALLAERVRPGVGSAVAISVITLGLAAKTALFPLHLWLPPAHARATPAASALLSALVIKGSFFVTVRIWFDVAPWALAGLGAAVLGAMGAGAVLVGGVMALRQAHLKSLIAYSTVAQIGYLFLIFPIGAAAGALAGGMFQAISHAFAKAAMFLAAGILAEVAGSDKLTALRGAGRVVPVTVFAFGVAAFSLVGVPPTGGFVTKWLLLSASFSSGQAAWALVLFAGGLLAGGYLFRAMRPLFEDGPANSTARIAWHREAVVVALAGSALLIGLFPERPLTLLGIGRPVSQGEVR